MLEETGHDVAVHEFLGTLAYQSGGRSKVVHFWRMEAEGGPVRKLTNDIKAVDWLTLDDAIARLSREYERAFLTQTGPIALAAAGLAAMTLNPYRPLFKLSPYTPAEQRQQEQYMLSMWIGSGVLLAGACGIIVWRRRVMWGKAAQPK